jgi:hypothetical protein
MSETARNGHGGNVTTPNPQGSRDYPTGHMPVTDKVVDRAPEDLVTWHPFPPGKEAQN